MQNKSTYKTNLDLKIIPNENHFMIRNLQCHFKTNGKNFNVHIYFDVITRFDGSLYLQQGQAENDDDDDENHVLIKKCVIGRQKELGSSQMRGSLCTLHTLLLSFCRPLHIDAFTQNHARYHSIFYRKSKYEETGFY